MQIRSVKKQKQVLSQELWLSFFNNYLLKADAISQEEYRMMNSLILKEISKQRRKSTL